MIVFQNFPAKPQCVFTEFLTIFVSAEARCFVGMCRARRWCFLTTRGGHAALLLATKTDILRSFSHGNQGAFCVKS